MVDYSKNTTKELLDMRTSYLQSIDRVTGLTGALIINALGKIEVELDKRIIDMLHFTWDVIAYDFLSAYPDMEAPGEEVRDGIMNFVYTHGRDTVLSSYFLAGARSYKETLCERAFPDEAYTY